jgi:hypothetical protein
MGVPKTPELWSGSEVLAGSTLMHQKGTFLVGMETEEGERVPEARAVKGLGS